MRSHSFVGLGLLLLAQTLYSPAYASSDTLRAPWEVESKIQLSAKEDLSASTVGRDYSYGLLKFYQEVLSVVMISRCPMTPSCSNYSLHAIHKHGAAKGILMTADRLYHEGSIQATAPRVWKDGKIKFFDPVENNDFWWHHEH